MFLRSPFRQSWHYIHPKTGRPVKQPRRYGDPRYINNEAALIHGLWGLITADFGCITMNQMEEARLEIVHRMPPSEVFQLIMHTDREEIPLGHKPAEARMGKGKTSIHHFVFKLTTGIPLFEIQLNPNVDDPRYKNLMSRTEAEIIFLKGRSCLPLETVVVPQGRVDEYHVFR